MPEVSGAWTNANHMAVAVYRGALAPVASVNDGYTLNTAASGTVIGYRALTPATRPATGGTGWFAAFASHKTATNVQTAPTGMTNLASGGTMIAVHDTAAPVSVAWPLQNVTVNASGAWMEATVQVAASATVSRVGAAAVDGTSIAIPSGHLIGDLILIFATNDTTGSTPTPPGGYTSLSSSSGAGFACQLAYKIATVSDTATVPVANFTGTPLSGVEPLTVAFTDTSTNTPTSWAWTFGDGGTSTAKNPSHSYTAAGTYTVALVATNSAGSNTKTQTGYVTVSDQPRPIRINTSQGWADIGDATSFVSGAGPPTAAIGATGAVYLDTSSGLRYGPKAAGAWPGTPIPYPGAPVAYGTTLPGSPTDGMEAILVDSTTAPTYRWRFRYNAASTSPYKWEFVGGTSASAVLQTQEPPRVVGSWTLPTTNAPTFTVPRAGDYYAAYGTNAYLSTTAGQMFTAVANLNVSATPAAAYPTGILGGPISTAGSAASEGVIAAAAAGDLLGFVVYSTVAGTLYTCRWLSVTPVRVS